MTHIEGLLLLKRITYRNLNMSIQPGQNFYVHIGKCMLLFCFSHSLCTLQNKYFFDEFKDLHYPF